MKSPLDPMPAPGRRSGDRGRNPGPPEADQGVLEDLVGYHLRRANAEAFGILQKYVPDLDVTAGQFGMLALIAANPGISQNALGRAQGIDKSTVAPAIAKLERRGLVSRQTAVHDRRAKALHLTEAGQTLFDAARSGASDADAQLTRNLSQDEKHMLIELLLKLYMQK